MHAYPCQSDIQTLVMLMPYYVINPPPPPKKKKHATKLSEVKFL